MAKDAKKTKVESKIPRLENWGEVDNALKQIAVSKARIKQETAEYNAREQEERNKLTESLLPYREEVEVLEQAVQLFAENNRADFGDVKTKELQHGFVQFRMSPPAVSAKKGFTFASALTLIQRSVKYAALFIRKKEELNKEEILTAVAAWEGASPENRTEMANAISPDALAEFGLQVTQAESFYYEERYAAGGDDV